MIIISQVYVYIQKFYSFDWIWQWEIHESDIQNYRDFSHKTAENHNSIQNKHLYKIGTRDYCMFSLKEKNISANLIWSQHFKFDLIFFSRENIKCRLSVPEMIIFFNIYKPFSSRSSHHLLAFIAKFQRHPLSRVNIGKCIQK